MYMYIVYINIVYLMYFINLRQSAFDNDIKQFRLQYAYNSF